VSRKVMGKGIIPTLTVTGSAPGTTVTSFPPTRSPTTRQTTKVAVSTSTRRVRAVERAPREGSHAARPMANGVAG
jgi:hypothetical protein